MKKKDVLSSVLWGLLFIAGGVLLLLDQLEVIEFSIGDWWPVVLIIIGVNIIFSSLMKE